VPPGASGQAVLVSLPIRGGVRLPAAVEPQNGWHWREWLAEGAGSGIVLFAVVTAKDLAVRAGPPFSDLRWSIAIIAVVAGLAVGAVAVSALGRRSGAHLNPALTMGLWLQRTVSPADLAGYWAAQLAGAVLGVALARIWGPTVPRPTVHWALLQPAPWITQLTAAGLECAATAVQLAVVFALLSSGRYHRWTPLAAAAMLTIGIIVLGPVSGGAFNPVRGLAPDLLAGTYPAVWIYIAGPLMGAALAAAAFAAVRRRPVTGKLRHDPAIPSYMRSDLRLLEEKAADAEIRAARRRRDRAAR
jgi:aquaporin Z